MRAILIALLVAAACSRSGAAEPQSYEMRHRAPVQEQEEVYKGWTCRDVRLFVQQEGKLKALSIAVTAGATASEIQKARDCLNGRKS